MNYFVSQIDLETVVSFFLIGAVFCGIYLTVSKLLWLIKSQAVLVLFKKSGSFAKIKENGKAIYEYKKSEKPSDFLRALMLLSLGVVITFLLYALCDGVPRIYALLCTAIGYSVAYFLFERILSTVGIYLFLPLFCFLIYVITKPLGLLVSTMRKNNQK